MKLIWLVNQNRQIEVGLLLKMVSAASCNQNISQHDKAAYFTTLVDTQ